MGNAKIGKGEACNNYNLIRWTTMRSIKETFVPPHHFAYPFMGEE